MRIIIISDTHGDKTFFDLINYHQADVMLHAGDSQLMKKDFIDKPILIVRGNCDFDNFDLTCNFSTEKNTFFMTHGDLDNVNFGCDEIVSLAKENGANICIYGHTHIVDVHKQDDIICINPGSFTRSLCAYPNSYMLLEEDINKLTLFDQHHHELDSWYLNELENEEI